VLPNGPSNPSAQERKPACQTKLLLHKFWSAQPPDAGALLNILIAFEAAAMAAANAARLGRFKAKKRLENEIYFTSLVGQVLMMV
jgi:hypothetical protein